MLMACRGHQERKEMRAYKGLLVYKVPGENRDLKVLLGVREMTEILVEVVNLDKLGLKEFR